MRVGVIKDWDSKWYADKKSFADYLVEDNRVREYVKKKLYLAGIARVLIERAADNQMRVKILAGKPGMIIGRSGAGTDELKKELEKLTGKTVFVDIIEVKRAELDAQLTAESIAQALERRISFRRAMKGAMGRTMKAGAKGMKVVAAGRLGGAEIARTEKYSEGNVPLHTLRADISYGFAEANTTYGRIGIKVWINHGEILDKDLKSAITEEPKEERRGRRDGDRRRRDRDDRPRRDGENRGERRGRRDDAPAAPKAVNPRKRIAPKAAPAPAEVPAEAEAAAEAPAEAPAEE
jgi:small subunit ribosomal protein S3